jgi:o-succinylbenzoate synthase
VVISGVPTGRASALDAGGEFAIAKVRLVPFRLPLRRPFATARSRIVAREGVLLAVVDGDGFTGWGEATPFPDFPVLPVGDTGSRETAGSCHAALCATIRPDARPHTAAEWLERAAEPLASMPVARSALDGALHDLVARRVGCSLASLLVGCGMAPRDRVPVNALVSADSPSEVARGARAARASGFGTVKLKLRADGGDRDRVRALRAALGPGPAIRLDANGAWDDASAPGALEELEPFAVEYVEQPIAPGRPEALARLREIAAIPIAADEDAVDAGSARRLIDLAAVDWLVLKPSACGGVGPALCLARRAAGAGIGVVVTSLLDAAVGRASALQLSAALAPPPPACGLATGGWLARDVAALPEPESGAITLPVGPGIGVAPRLSTTDADTEPAGVAGAMPWTS